MDDLRVLLVTFPGQGFINPSLQLAKRLAAMGLTVTFVTAASALNRMAKATATPPAGLTFAPLSDTDLDLDGDFETYVTELQRPGSEAVAEIITSAAGRGQPFNLVVYTLLLPWVGQIAGSLNLPSTFFWVQPAALFGLYYHYLYGYGDAIREIISDPSLFVDLPGLPRLHNRDLPSFIQASNVNSGPVPLVREHLGAVATERNPKILVNSFDALEPEALRVIENIDFVAVGPLIPSAFLDGKDPSDTSFGGDLFHNKLENYMEWLNSKPRESVVYVSFGSLVVLSDQQKEELARGLLESRRPFLWVMRGSEKGEKLSRKEELEELGMMVPWCSQVEVLQHPSLGCFVSHCGWNSTVESLVSGVPVVGFPQWSDQATNAKLVEDVWMTGKTVGKNEEGVAESGEIKRCIEMVMEGEEMRRNAKKWKDLAKEAAIEGGSSDLNLKAFVAHVKAEIRG
ncbi:crocetin glucosyltransferase, chloroplastic-like [Diospyros lotus]|uniref:crocetin glucosyltransferase, chloroplastic-like n=1 Tax=Diospyros lotus TaxID=55363 RepID=UPI0022570576|nr:crocetin glucosyltransferase, chloroplastic-like [Diospyros lotus]